MSQASLASSSAPQLSLATLQRRRPLNIARQLDEASNIALPNNPDIEDLPVLVWNHRRFIEEYHIARKGRKGRTSWIRRYGKFLVELNNQNEDQGAVWCCGPCDEKNRPEFFNAVATSSATQHLRK